MEWNNNIKKECKNYTNCSHYRRTPQSVSLQNNKSNNKDYHFQNRPCTKISESIYKAHIQQYCQNHSRQYKCQFAFPPCIPTKNTKTFSVPSIKLLYVERSAYIILVFYFLVQLFHHFYTFVTYLHLIQPKTHLLHLLFHSQAYHEANLSLYYI